MPTLGGTTLETLTEVRNHISLWMGASAYTSLETEEQTIVDISIAKALRQLSRDIKGPWIEKEGSFTTGINVTGNEPTIATTGTVTIGDETVSSIAANLTTKGVLANDKMKGAQDGFCRISSITSTSELELVAKYSEATTVGLSITFGRDEYTLASGVVWIRSIFDVDAGDKIDIVTGQEWLDITGGTWEVGTPRYACIMPSDGSAGAGTQQKLRLWPIPDKVITYTYNYYSIPTFPASGSARFETSPHLSDLLIHKALAYVFWHRQEPEERDRHEIEYKRLLKEAAAEEMGRGNSLTRMAGQWEDNSRYRPRYPDLIVAPFPVGV